MITYEDIKKANETLFTTDIKGKEYVEVNQRIKAFRMVYPNGSINTDIVSLENGVVIMKAAASNEEGKIIGTGLAYEKENSTYINKTSYIENCETSAVGRALGMCGFGIDTSVCSAEELQNALKNQEETKSGKGYGKVLKGQIEELVNIANEKGYSRQNLINGVKKRYGKELQELNQKEYQELLDGYALAEVKG